MIQRLRIRLRAIRVSHHSRRLRDAEHIAWAHALIAKPRVLHRNTRDLLPLAGRYDDSEFELPFRPAPGWSEDPFDGFPYPAVR